MDLQHRVKPLAVLLSLSVVVSLPLTHRAFAQTTESGTELTPILLMEETARPTPADSSQMEPPVPMLDLEESIPASPSSIVPAVPTKNLKEIIGSEPAQTPAMQQPSMATAAAASDTPATSQATQGTCHFTSQLNLTHNQLFRLKHWKKNFERDNQAAFDSIRIKRNLLKRLGNNPASGRERQQSEELKVQIRQEFKALQAKRDAQIAHVLSDAQYEKWHQLRQDCQPQAATPGIIFNRNPEESQMRRSLQRNY